MTLPSLLIRKLIPADVSACAAIDSGCAADAWTILDFNDFLACPAHGGHVAAWEGRVVGFVLYQADRADRRLQLARIGVAVRWRRRRVGSRLVQQVRQWLRAVPDVTLCMLVNERQLAMQCFLRANAFRAVRVCRGRFDEGESDGYLFELPVCEQREATCP